MPGYRQCAAKSKQSGERCKRRCPAGCPCDKCYMHGCRGGAASRGKQNTATLVTGERSLYVPKALLPEVVAELASIEKDPALAVRTNLAERRVRRRNLPAEVANDLDVVGQLDTHDRGDTAVLFKAAEIAANEKPAAAPTIVLGDIAAVVQVRTAEGAWCRAMTVPNEPDRWLLEDKQTGAWWPARAVQRDGEEIYERVIAHLPEESTK